MRISCKSVVAMWAVPIVHLSKLSKETDDACPY